MERKVLVIDDSAYNRRAICGLLESMAGVDVVATAVDGVDGLRQVVRFAPDLIMLDLDMPNMDGFTFLRLLNRMQKTPVIVITGMGWNGYASKAFKLGAYDFIEKPSMHPSKALFSIRGELEEKMRMAPRMRLKGTGRGAGPRPVKEDSSPGLPDVVAIGASTGGLKAISSVINMLPGSCPLSVVVSVHIPAWLTTPFVERLKAGSTITVQVAGDGEKVRRGCVLVTPGGCHVSFVRRRGSVYTRLVKADPGDIYAPSIDRMFASAAKTWGNALVGVVMTGMGSDGKSGVREIKENGGYVLAESKQSSEVFSMPEAAISTGMVDRVLSTHEVGAWILRRPPVCRPELA